MKPSKPNNNKAKTLTSVGIDFGLTIIGIICPPLGVLASTVTTGAGVGMKLVGSLVDDEDWVEVGNVIENGAEIGEFGNKVTTLVPREPHDSCRGCKRLSK